MTSPLRVAFIIDRLIPGAGTENQLSLLLEHFDRTQIEPHLVCLWDTPDLPRERIRCPVHILYGPSVFSWNGLRSMGALRRLADTHHWQVVVTFFRDSNIIGTLGGKLAHIPVVSSRRNLGRNYWHNRRELLALKFLNPLSAGIITNSEAVARYTVAAEGVNRTRIHVIPNAIQELDEPARKDAALRREWGVDEDGLVLGCVANLRFIKGLDVLIDAFAQLAGEFPQVKLVLVGEGEQRGVLEALVRKRDRGDRVLFLGRREDVRRITGSFDIGVLASRGESSSNALLEYLSSGLPIVATNVGGNPELISDGDTGLLVPPDDPRAMAGALLTLCRDSGLRQRLGVAGEHAVYERHALKPVLQQWVDRLRSFAGHCGEQAPSGGV